MRHILITAAGLVACSLLASTTVQAQTFQQGGPIFEPGGPARVGSMCKVTTGYDEMDAYGYYAPCPSQAFAYEPAPVRQAPPSRRGYR